MSLEKLVDAIGQIDPVYVEEAEQWKKEEPGRQADTEQSGRMPSKKRSQGRRRRFLYQILPTAACLVLLLSGALYIARNGLGIKGGSDKAAQDQNAGSDGMNSGEVSGEEIENCDDNDGAAQGSSSEIGDTTDDKPEQTHVPNTGLGQETLQEFLAAINEIDQIKLEYISQYGEADEASYKELGSLEELEAAYGITIQAAWLPTGMELTDYRSPAEQLVNEGTGGSAAYASARITYNAAGKVLNDNNTLHYMSRTGAQELFQSVRTVESGWIATLGEGQWETVTVQDVQMLIGHCQSGEDSCSEQNVIWSGSSTEEETANCYIAIFQKGKVTFTIITRGLSGQELFQLLTSI